MFNRLMNSTSGNNLYGLGFETTKEIPFGISQIQPNSGDPSRQLFFGDYQPILDANSARPLNLIHPKLNQPSTQVVYDFVKSQIIIKTQLSNESLCYLKELVLPPDLLSGSGDVASVLRELTSERYVKSILDIETDSLYNPKDVLTPELHGAKVTEVCSSSKIYQLVPGKLN